jgi:uncharacterized YigZ family protein
MADPWSYWSPSVPARSEFREQSSLFLGCLSPAASEDEAALFLRSLRREFHDATHHCWAYRIGWNEGLRSRCSDNGEPSRTAGAPILAALENHEVSDACLVVVRYFGGVKLGTGGLARAYRRAAVAAIEATDLVARTLCEDWLVSLPYAAQGALRRAAAAAGVELLGAIYDELLTLTARVPLGSAGRFSAALRELSEAWKGGVAWRSK